MSNKEVTREIGPDGWMVTTRRIEIDYTTGSSPTNYDRLQTPNPETLLARVHRYADSNGLGSNELGQLTAAAVYDGGLFDFALENLDL